MWLYEIFQFWLLLIPVTLNGQKKAVNYYEYFQSGLKFQQEHGNSGCEH